MQSDPLVGACSEVAPRVPPSDASKAIWPRPPSRRYAGDHSGRKYDLGATRRVCLPACLTVSVWSVSVSVSVSVCAIPPRIWPLHHAVHRYIPLPARAQQHTPFPATTSTLTAFNCVIVRACVFVCWLAILVHCNVMYCSSDYCGLPSVLTYWAPRCWNCNITTANTTRCRSTVLCVWHIFISGESVHGACNVSVSRF